jgi:B12-binding domain/radical SAM domain protein
MQSRLTLVFFYLRRNRYGMNALAGALDTDPRTREIASEFPESERDLWSALRDAVEASERVAVLFSFSTAQVWDMHRVMGTLRDEFGNGVVCIAGGPHPTGDPEGTLGFGFDAVAEGEGEETIVEIALRLREGSDWKTVPGLVRMDETGTIRRMEKRSFVDLDKYAPFSERYRKFGPIELTRGCPFACAYCQTTHLHGARPRQRSVDVVIETTERMVRRNLKDYRFISPDAFSYGSTDGRHTSPDTVEQLLSRMRQTIGPDRRLAFGSFPSEVRPEHVSPEMVELVRRYANNDNLNIGGQSGSAKILERCHRGHSVGDVFRAVEIAHRGGLRANVDFIFGLPGETEEDIRDTVRAMTELGRMGARLHAHTFMPLPQTPFAREPAGSVDNEILTLLNTWIPEGLLYGSWREQERLAKRIAYYLQTGSITAQPDAPPPSNRAARRAAFAARAERMVE